MRAVVAEDDAALRRCSNAGSGERLGRRCRGGRSVGPPSPAGMEYDVAVFDWRIPSEPGWTLSPKPERGDRTPILTLTSATAADRVAGLDRGADDYLVKPFEFAEPVARVPAPAAPPALSLDPVLQCADLRFDPSTGR